jgi:sec-independent protein translocase protein TatA
VQLGPAEILVVLVIALLVFGPQKLPEVGRQVGRAMKEFRRFQDMMTSDFKDVFSEDASSSAEPAPQLPPKEPIDVVGTDVPASGTPVSGAPTNGATAPGVPGPSDSVAPPAGGASGVEPEGHA